MGMARNWGESVDNVQGNYDPLFVVMSRLIFE